MRRSPGPRVPTVADVLDGGASYDDLEPREQGLVRAEREKRVKATREALNLADEFRASGQIWSAADPADPAGRPVIHNALSLSQVADKLGISRSTVARRIATGDLPSHKFRGRHHISPADFERFRDAYVHEMGSSFADDF